MDLDDVSPALQTRLGPEATAGLLALFDTARRECEVEVTSAVVERFERRLTTEISTLGHDLRGEMRAGEARLCEEMRDLAAALRQDSRDQTASWREQMRGDVHDLRIELRQAITDFPAELKHDNSILRLELKDDINNIHAGLKDDISNVHVALNKDISDVRVELKEDISSLRIDMSKLRVDVTGFVGAARADMMRWSFGLWVGQVAATAAIVAGMFRVFAQ